MSRTIHRYALAAIVAASFVSACAKPPSEVIARADQAQQAAMAAGAEEYAPEALNSVSEAKAALDAEIAAQGEKMSLTRSYKHAEELALAYETAAGQATTAATTAKETARTEATDLIAQGRTELEAVRAMLASAPQGKGSRADLAAMGADLDAASASLSEAENALTSEMYLDARSKASSAMTTIGQVRSSIEQAQAARAGL
ncbi:MAG TPA: hypothetical protein VLA36_14885 [Longimicrobiales bacterium]|nr:hypothetical protein [Longimicrobiales bacterium]